jgi:hypothetical protein
MGDSYQSKVTKTRVVAFISEKDDYIEEIKNLKKAGRASA